MRISKEEGSNVMILTLAIVLLVVIVSVLVLWSITKDAYLDAYFVLETLTDAQNTAASTELAGMAFSYASHELIPVLAVVVADNLSRILVVSFVLAAVLDILDYANFEEFLSRAKVFLMRGHVIVCGYNSIAQTLIEDLKGAGIDYVIIDKQDNKNQELNQRRITNITGDFSDQQTLKAAGISRACAVVLTSPDDVRNVVGALAARLGNPKIRILSRLGDESVRRKVYGIGVDVAVIPEQLTGLEIGNFLLKRYGE